MSKKKIKEAVIPAAGFGSRFLPFTKVVPKELIPIGNMPLIAYAISEALESGVEKIILVTSKNKQVLENFFRPHSELYRALEERGKDKELTSLKKFDLKDRLQIVYQPEALGLGHAILMAQEYVKGEHFFVLLPDDLFPDNNNSVLQQMLKVFQDYNSSLLSVRQVPKKDTCNYGVLSGVNKITDSLFDFKGLVEKPDPQDAPSDYVISGRYLLSSKVFDYIKANSKGSANEIQLTDAIALMLSEEKTQALLVKGRYFDCGKPEGVIKAYIEMLHKGTSNLI